jgi:sugar phosphate isomerase/epimerase
MGAAKPNSRIKGVQIGTITYSFRSMPDQSAQATLQYCLDSGISAIELMGGPLNDYIRKEGKWESSPAAAAAAAAGQGGRGGRGFGAGGPGGGRGPAQTYPAAAGMQTGFGNSQPAGQWNGVTCPAGRGGGAGGAGARGAQPGGAPAGGEAARGAGAGAPGAAGQGGGGGRGRGEQTPEQKAAAEAERKWRLALPMSMFKDLRKMYNDAGVTIYAVKDLRQGTDDDLEYTFTVAKTLGATHVTTELMTNDSDGPAMKRLGDWAMKHKMFVAYHSHGQGSMTAFDVCFAASPGNRSNVDLGHFTAAQGGELALNFLNKFHDKIASFHMKDRTGPSHCELNLPWGLGETPIKEILQAVSKNKWTMPASIEQEYAIPEGSDAVKEVAKCLEFCRAALA